MKQFVLALLLINLCGLLSVAADDNVRDVQTRLKKEGFYLGSPDGVYSSKTAAAVTRYQIRHGLPITGKLDAVTAKALGARPLSSAAGGPVTSMSGTWRQLRNGEQQFVPEKVQTSPAIERQPKSRGAQVAPSATPPPLARRDFNESAFGLERLRDYVGAFILAGLDPQVGAELDFFADRVDYFGDGKISRQKIRRDLLRYDAHWPERRFWLAGELQVAVASDQRASVSFPLRYELRSRSDRASGTVRKTLVLEKNANNDLEIVAVNEKKIR